MGGDPDLLHVRGQGWRFPQPERPALSCPVLAPARAIPPIPPIPPGWLAHAGSAGVLPQDFLT